MYPTVRRDVCKNFPEYRTEDCGFEVSVPFGPRFEGKRIRVEVYCQGEFVHADGPPEFSLPSSQDETCLNVRDVPKPSSELYRNPTRDVPKPSKPLGRVVRFDHPGFGATFCLGNTYKMYQNLTIWRIGVVCLLGWHLVLVREGSVPGWDGLKRVQRRASGSLVFSFLSRLPPWQVLLGLVG